MYRAPHEHEGAGTLSTFASIYPIERLSEDGSVLSLVLGDNIIYDTTKGRFFKRKNAFEKHRLRPYFDSYEAFLVYAIDGMMAWYLDQVLNKRGRAAKRQDSRLDYTAPKFVACVLEREYAQLMLGHTDGYPDWDESHIQYKINEI